MRPRRIEAAAVQALELIEGVGGLWSLAVRLQVCLHCIGGDAEPSQSPAQPQSIVGPLRDVTSRRQENRRSVPYIVQACNLHKHRRPGSHWAAQPSCFC